MKILSIITVGAFLLFGFFHTNVLNVKNKKVENSKGVVATLQKGKSFSFENYETNKIPIGWTQFYTGASPVTEWKIVDDNGNKVLAQLSKEDVKGHFNEIVYDELKVKNVELEVSLKGISGERDQGGGFVWRFIDADNHYIVRANPLEDNVVLYKMENGVRTDLPLVGKGKTYGVEVPPLGAGWNDLKLTVVDEMFTVYLNGKEIFKVKDKTFTKAGKVGLWTKADAVTYFDNFAIKGLK